MFQVLSLLGRKVEMDVFMEAMSDWHSHEHIMYNMLVEVFRAEPALSQQQSKVYPELALLNCDGDRISKNIDAVKSHPFVNPQFVPVRANWIEKYHKEVERKVFISRASEDSVVSEGLKAMDIKDFARYYRKLYLSNLLEIKKVASK